MLAAQQAGAAVALPSRTLTVAHAKAESSKKATVAVALAASLMLGCAAPAFADFQSGEQFLRAVGDTKCSESKQFKKMQAKQLKSLERRQKAYEEGSPVYDYLNTKKMMVEKSFGDIAASGQWCDENGVPGLIADPGLAFKVGRAQDVVIPMFGLLYFNGWLLHQGKKYLKFLHDNSKDAGEAREKELGTFWSLPMALYFLSTGWAWPVDAFNEWKSGRLIADGKYVTDVPY